MWFVTASALLFDGFTSAERGFLDTSREFPTFHFDCPSVLLRDDCGAKD